MASLAPPPPRQALGLLFDASYSAVQLRDIRVTGPRTIEADWLLGGYLKFPWHPRVEAFEGGPAAGGGGGRGGVGCPAVCAAAPRPLCCAALGNGRSGAASKALPGRADWAGTVGMVARGAHGRGLLPTSRAPAGRTVDQSINQSLLFAGHTVYHLNERGLIQLQDQVRPPPWVPRAGRAQRGPNGAHKQPRAVQRGPMPPLLLPSVPPASLSLADGCWGSIFFCACRCQACTGPPSTCRPGASTASPRWQRASLPLGG